MANKPHLTTLLRLISREIEVCPPGLCELARSETTLAGALREVLQPDVCDRIQDAMDTALFAVPATDSAYVESRIWRMIETRADSGIGQWRVVGGLQ